MLIVVNLGNNPSEEMLVCFSSRMVSVSKDHELKYFRGDKWGHFHWRVT